MTAGSGFPPQREKEKKKITFRLFTQATDFNRPSLMLQPRMFPLLNEQCSFFLPRSQATSCLLSIFPPLFPGFLPAWPLKKVPLNGLSFLNPYPLWDTGQREGHHTLSRSFLAECTDLQTGEQVSSQHDGTKALSLSSKVAICPCPSSRKNTGSWLESYALLL